MTTEEIRCAYIGHQWKEKEMEKKEVNSETYTYFSLQLCLSCGDARKIEYKSVKGE